MINCFQVLLSNSTCAVTARGARRADEVGRCRVTPVFGRGLTALGWFQRLKLKYDETISKFAFNFNLRHYNEAEPPHEPADDRSA